MSNSTYLFFDSASTTRCCEEAAALVQQFAVEDYGNPSSSHVFGQRAARAILKSRQFFAAHFNVEPNQIIFTGSGTESDNLAIYGVATHCLQKRGHPIRIIASKTEHPAVRKTVESLVPFGVEVKLAEVDSTGQIDREKFRELLTPETALVSIHRVNNIVGTILPVEELAREVKEKCPQALFHTDAVQAFGRVSLPRSHSAVDLVSISAHKIQGPKGIGALIVLNKALLKSGMRPLIWGGDQEGGLRSGTQSAGLITGFHAAAEKTLSQMKTAVDHTTSLRQHFRELLAERKLLDRVHWNSPEDAVPHIVNLSVPQFPSGPLAKLLEERLCLVSTGSACSSLKQEPDAVLKAMGLSLPFANSTLRVSFSASNTLEEVDTLAHALEESLARMSELLGLRTSQ
jgi:cysteine desulfurase